MSIPEVVRAASLGWQPLRDLLEPFGLQIQIVPAEQAIPGSHWGDDEAGLIGSRLYARTDTPVHSILHESGHWLLMEPERRLKLHTDAGGIRLGSARRWFEEDAEDARLALLERLPHLGSSDWPFDPAGIEPRP